MFCINFAGTLIYIVFYKSRAADLKVEGPLN